MPRIDVIGTCSGASTAIATTAALGELASVAPPNSAPSANTIGYLDGIGVVETDQYTLRAIIRWGAELSTTSPIATTYVLRLLDGGWQNTATKTSLIRSLARKLFELKNINEHKFIYSVIHSLVAETLSEILTLNGMHDLAYQCKKKTEWLSAGIVLEILSDINAPSKEVELLKRMAHTICRAAICTKNLEVRDNAVFSATWAVQVLKYTTELYGDRYLRNGVNIGHKAFHAATTP